MLKNPWNHLRWKGRFCENDTINWTPEMQKALNYDPKNAQTYDNGMLDIGEPSSVKEGYNAFAKSIDSDQFAQSTPSEMN